MFVEMFLEWFGYEAADFMVNLAVAMATGIFVMLVFFQIHFDSVWRKQQAYNFQVKNRLETFKQMEEYRIEHIFDGVITNKLIDKVTIEKTNKEEYEQVLLILIELDILGIKYSKLSFDIEIIYNLLGNTIIEIHKNPTVQEIINGSQKYRYVNFIKMVEDLEREEGKED